MARKLTVSSMCVVMAAIFLIQPALADDNNLKQGSGLVVSPPLVELKAKPGEIIAQTIKIQNPTGNNLHVDVVSSDIGAKDESGNPTVYEGKKGDAYSLMDWFELSPGFEVKSGDTKTYNYRLIVPKDATPGGHYGTLIFKPSASRESLEGSGAVIQSEIASLVLLNIAGDITYDGKITNFFTSKPNLQEPKKTMFFWKLNNDISFITRFQNDSNTFVKPKGNVLVKNMLGKQIEVLNVNDQNGNVLSMSARRYETKWTKSKGFGIYSATSAVAYGDGKSAKSKTTNFVIIPIKEIGIGLLILLFLIWMIKNNKKKR